MPTERSRTTINNRWARQKRSSRSYRNRPPLPPREAEIEAIERFAAERGITQLPPAEPPTRSGSRVEAGNSRPLVVPAWRE